MVCPSDLAMGTVRVRVNGLLVENDKLLMVRLFSPVANRLIWMPPGGGVLFGETLKNTLKREMQEETGLHVDPGDLWYIHEVITGRVHAVEFYFRCTNWTGTLITGIDPEYENNYQIIQETAFIDFDRLQKPDIYPEYLREGFVSDLNDRGFSPPVEI